MQPSFRSTFKSEFKKNLAGEVRDDSYIGLSRYKLYYVTNIVAFFAITAVLTTLTHSLLPEPFNSQWLPAYLFVAMIPAGYLSYRISKVLHKRLIATLEPSDPHSH